MFCPDCGSELTPDARFCFRCGNELPDAVMNAPQTGEDPAPSDRATVERGRVDDEATTPAPERGPEVPRVAPFATRTRGARSIAGRLGLGLVLLALIGLAGAFLYETARVESHEQPLLLSIGLLAVGLAVIVLNQLTRRYADGLMDRVFEWLTAAEINKVALAVALLSGLILVVEAAAELRFHFSDEAAAAAFSRQDITETITNSGRVLFSRTPDGVTHAAWIRPGLVRALRNRGTSVNPEGANDLEYPLPGILPLLVLLAVFVHVFRSGGKGWETEERAGRRFLLTFGVIQLYVLGWSVSGVARMFYPDMRLHPEWLLPILMFVILSALFLGAIYWLQTERSGGALAGWLALFFLVHLTSIAGSYAISSAADGSPVFFWTVAYMFVASSGWLAAAPEF